MNDPGAGGLRHWLVALGASLCWPQFAPGSDVGKTFDIPVAVSGFEVSGAEVSAAWRVGSSSVRASIQSGLGPDGSHAVILATNEDQPEPRQGALAGSIDAVALRGRRLRFSAATRILEGQPDAFLWFRADDAEGNTLSIVRQPVTQAQWTRVNVLGSVSDAASRIVFGLFVSGAGTAAIDDVSLAALGLITDLQAPPRALTSRALSNIVSLAKLYGHVRYFHPDARAANANWDELLWQAIPLVEDAASEVELRRSLERLFCPVTSGVAFGGEPTPIRGTGTDILAWRHTGFGDSTMKGIYSSQLQAPPDDLPGASRLRAAGTEVSIPLQLSARDATSYPAGRCVGFPDDIPEGLEFGANDRTSRLLSVIVAWSALRNFYPYFDVISVQWEDELQRALRSAATDTGPQDFERTLQRMIAALGDGHGRVFGPQPSGRLPLEWMLVEGKLVVTESEVPSVHRGDIVASIDGTPVAQLIEDWAVRVSAATDGWREVRILQEMQAGALGSTRALELERANGSTDLIQVATVPPETVLVPRLRPAALAEIEPGHFYLDLTRITDEQMSASLDRLATARGYVFDLRGYPTGAALNVIRHLTDENLQSDQYRLPIYSEPEQRNVKFQDVSWNLPPLPPRLRGRAVFLTDARAISYGESLMGIVEHAKLGIIVGSRTAGTNGNIASLTLPTSHQIMWTGMQVLKRGGGRLHGVGISPNVEIVPTIQDLRMGVDTVLEAGVRVLRNVHAP